MDEVIKFFVIAVLVVSVCFCIGGKFKPISFPADQIECSLTPRHGTRELSPSKFVARAVPSITKFELIGTALLPFSVDHFWSQVLSGNSSGLEPIPVGSLLGSFSELHVELFPKEGFRSTGFEILLDNLPHSNAEPLIYTGSLENKDYPNSLVVLYGSQSDPVTLNPAFVSGFILFDKEDLESDWVFIEPLRPLLRPLTDEEMPRSRISWKDKFSKVKEIPRFSSRDINRCFTPGPNDSATHIVYLTRGGGFDERRDIHFGGDSGLSTLDTGAQRDPNTTIGNQQQGQGLGTVLAPPFINWLINLDPVRQVKTSKSSTKKLVVTKLTAPCILPLGDIIGIKGTLTNFTDSYLSIDVEDIDVFVAKFPERSVGSSGAHAEISYLSIDPSIMFPGSRDRFAKNRHFQISVPRKILGELIPGIFILRIETDVSSMSRLIYVKEGATRTNCIDLPLPDQLENRQINMTAYSDVAYHELYENVIEDKTWWQGQEEVLTLAESFYEILFEGLDIQIHALQSHTRILGEKSSVRDGVIPDSKFNAYSALCEYAQGVFSTRTGSLIPDDFRSHFDPGGREILIINSGRDFGPIPDFALALSDVGSICSATCSTAGSAIVGLAEGLYGLISSISESCAKSPEPTSQEIFNPPSHHALVQDLPKLNFSKENPNSNYQVTLYQRFTLMVHEMGHLLGANHNENIIGIMHPSLRNTIRFYLDDESSGEIKACLLYCPTLSSSR